MQYLLFDLTLGADGVSTLEAMASTSLAQHAAVMAEAHEVLDWARHHFGDTQGPAEDGMDWDHDLQIQAEPGGWHTVTLTLTASERFVDDFLAAFGPERD